MRNLCTVLSVLFALGTAPLYAASYQFQALIDLDGDAISGCAVESGGTILGGSELRSFARSDRTEILEVVLQSCRDATWHDVLRSSETLALGFGEGEAGSDRISWSLPLHPIAAPPRISLRLLSERLDLPAQDIVGDGTAAVVLELNLGDQFRAIPAVGGIGLVFTALLMLWSGRRHFGAYTPLAIGLALAFATVQLVHPISRAKADLALSAVALDAGNDSADAGSDVLRVQVAVVGKNLEFQFDVNNIEDSGLADNAKVLFIGNSLTYYNDMPLMLQAIAAQAGKVLVADAITLPGAALEDHFHQHTADAALASGQYQWVIMQQGPSSLPQNQDHLRRWVSRFDPLIRAGGARPALYMVWPDASRSAYFDDVRDSYSNAALAANGMFIPAGEAWREAWRANPGLPLYGSDRFHPSKLGSYAAALSMFSELYQQSPTGLPAQFRLTNGVLFGFDPEQVRTVQTAVWRTHLAFGRRGG